MNKIGTAVCHFRIEENTRLVSYCHSIQRLIKLLLNVKIPTIVCLLYIPISKCHRDMVCNLSNVHVFFS